MFCVAVAVALAAVGVWQGLQANRAHRADLQRKEFLRAGRQVAVDLTTIDYNRVDADVARILDVTTGDFHDDFAKRAKPFVDVVKSSQSTSVGQVVESGLESVQGAQAMMLVAVQVTTSSRTEGDQPKHGWRLRIGLVDDGETVKASDVQFVS
ncbi:mammalian cell entry protein [Mycolicibacterium moriokaense]|nr:mammalian cell entry protein [Mycolicibacterium moriokaense]